MDVFTITLVALTLIPFLAVGAWAAGMGMAALFSRCSRRPALPVTRGGVATASRSARIVELLPAGSYKLGEFPQ